MEPPGREQQRDRHRAAALEVHGFQRRLLGSAIRYYYDGLCDWCGSGYSAGQEWASIGAWFNPWPWNTSTTYVDHVKGHIANRTWARADF